MPSNAEPDQSDQNRQRQVAEPIGSRRRAPFTSWPLAALRETVATAFAGGVVAVASVRRRLDVAAALIETAWMRRSLLVRTEQKDHQRQHSPSHRTSVALPFVGNRGAMSHGTPSAFFAAGPLTTQDASESLVVDHLGVGAADATTASLGIDLVLARACRDWCLLSRLSTARRLSTRRRITRRALSRSPLSIPRALRNRARDRRTGDQDRARDRGCVC